METSGLRWKTDVLPRNSIKATAMNFFNENVVSAIRTETKSTSFGNWKPDSAEPKEPNPKPKVRKAENEDNLYDKNHKRHRNRQYQLS